MPYTMQVRIDVRVFVQLALDCPPIHYRYSCQEFESQKESEGKNNLCARDVIVQAAKS
jgi:hypothetical protein